MGDDQYQTGIDLICVNYRTAADLAQFLTSLVDNQPTVPFHLWVVQVCPDGASLEVFNAIVPRSWRNQSEWATGAPRATGIFHTQNVGFNWAVNEAAARGDHTFIGVFNADVTITPGSIDTLFGALWEDLNAAAIGPRQTDRSGRITAGGIFGTNAAPKHRGWRATNGAEDCRANSITLAGSAMIWRRTAWDDLTTCMTRSYGKTINVQGPDGHVRHWAPGAMGPMFHYYGETWACLAAGTWVWGPLGPTPIEDVQPGHQVYGYSDGRMWIGDVTKAGTTGTKSTFTVKARGRTVTATADHRLLVAADIAENGSGGVLEWKRVDELIVGSDCIVAATTCPPGSESAVLPSGGPATADLIQFLGAYTGDGASDGRSITLCFPEESPIRRAYERMAEASFSKLVRWTRRGRPSADHERVPVSIKPRPRSFRFSTVEGAQLLRDLGLTGNAHTKRIPPWIFGLPRDLRLRFLAGLIDSDGTVDRSGTAVIGLANRSLIEDIRLLLVSCGLPASAPTLAPGGAVVSFPGYTSVASDSWRVSCAEPAEIPFCDERYRSRVRDVPRRGGHSIGDVPLDRQQFAVRRITDVVPAGEVEVYDLTVPGLDSFIADGMVVHNCYHARAHGWTLPYHGTVTVGHEWHTSSPQGGIGEQALEADRAAFRRLCDHHQPAIERD